MKFKRFFLIKTEGKGEGEFYRIPIAPVVILFIFFVLVIVGRFFWINSESSPLIFRKEQLIQLQKDNRQLDSILRSIRVQMDSTKMNSDEILKRAQNLRELASLAMPVKDSVEKKQDALSISFLQSYTDTISKYLEKIASDSTNVFWSSLPTISPLSAVNSIVKVRYGAINESFSGVQQRCNGIVFAAPKGTSVYSTAAGIVEENGKHPQKGKYLIIRHENSLVTSYSHLETLLVAKGERVKKSEIIGRVGQSGRCVGPQLLYELTKNGKSVDPTLLIQEVK